MLTQEYIELVKVLKGVDLQEFVKKFFLCKYKGDGITVVECEWIDACVLTIMKNRSDIKRFIHISTETDKLSDFLDANLSNIEQHSAEKLFRKIECFCLYQVQEKDVLKERADLDFGVALDIYDLDYLGSFIEKEKVLKDFLVSISPKPSMQQTQFNRKDKILYDLFTTGNKIADIKNSFIGSYIQYYLLEMGPQTKTDLKNNLQKPLPNLSSRAFNDAIRRSVNDGIIHCEKEKCSLTDEYKHKIEEIQAVTTATEERLLQKFESCLEEYLLKGLSHDILEIILGLYKEQNHSEIATLNHTDEAGVAERKLVNELFDYLIKKVDKSVANSLVQRILEIVSGSEYLNKVSATTLFTSLFNSNSLEDYLGKQKRVVFLDTQVLMQLLCVDYKNDVPYRDSLYEAGRILYNQLDESRNYLHLFTTSDYVREVSNHLYEAYNLKRFVNLSFVKDFGPSKNIFYNFYLFLNENDVEQYECYVDYISELLNTDECLPSNYYSFVAITDTLVADILNNIGITIKPIESPANLLSLRKDYDFLLGNHPKSINARENDVKCMFFLSDQTNFINTETGLNEEPYLITLDTTISPMRKKLVEKYQRCYWYIYPPLKFANRLSIMNLKLDSKNINYDIICMAETNFKASYDTISMLDIMSMFFKNDEIESKKLPRLLSKIKEEERKDDHFRDYSEKNHNNLPIDVVLNAIHRHYRNQGMQNLDNISKLFEIDEMSEQITVLLKNGCNAVLKSNKLDNSIFEELDKLVEQHILS